MSRRAATDLQHNRKDFLEMVNVPRTQFWRHPPPVFLDTCLQFLKVLWFDPVSQESLH